jgi:peptidoglycan/xylan/chitin deacetylase (PgdA/CDA1 family)
MGAILGFHSFTTRGLPGNGEAHVRLEWFRRAVGLARKSGEIVPLDLLIQRHAEGRSTAGLVAITLDDAYLALSGGFADFVSAEAVPVSVFVVTGAAASGDRFWWDRVDDAFPHLSLERWRTFEDACGLPDEYRRRQPRAFGPLRPLRQWMLARHAGRWPRQLEPALEALEADAAATTAQRAMRFDELAAFAKLPTVSLGVHTVTHPVLPLIPDDERAREISACHDALRSRFDHVLPVLAFPFALYDQRTLATARAAGMRAGLTLAGTMLRPEDDVLTLPRICLTKRDSIVRLAARLFGLTDAVRNVTGRRTPAYPQLPSAAT